MSKGALWAISICLVGVLLEGLFAGRGVKRHLAQLHQPPLSPPFAVWVGIGVLYYLVCFIVLSRLINFWDSPLWGVTLALMLILLIGNAAWNLVFFRLKNVRASTVVMLAYLAIALLVATLLTRIDRVSSWVFLPYLIYLLYAAWWSLSVWRLNREVRSGVA